MGLQIAHLTDYFLKVILYYLKEKVIERQYTISNIYYCILSSNRLLESINKYIHNIIDICSTVHNFGVSKICNLFKEVSYAHQGYIYLIQNKNSHNSNIVKYYYNCNRGSVTVICSYFCDGKADFQQALLQPSVSHDMTL